jgi:hypothetical protein
VQLDYRNNPSAGNTDGSDPSGNGALGTYDQPTPADAVAGEPWTDQTWEGYDEAEDAARFRGINTPRQQAELHGEPDPVTGSQGWSPDLEQSLAWQRQVDGSPPMYRGGPA